MNHDDEHAHGQRHEAAAVRRPTMSPLGAMVLSMGESLANVSKEAYRQGREFGLAEGERKRKALEAALEECLEYFEDRYDIVDGEYSQPTANREMQLGQMIEEALGRRP